MKKHKYSQHNIKTVGMVVGIFIMIMGVIVIIFGGQYKGKWDHNKNPSCMKVEDYNGGEDEDGCILATQTLTPDYQQIFSLSFSTFYMNGEASAEAKYQTLLKTMNDKDVFNQKETKISDTSKVTFFLTTDKQVYFVVKSQTTVYFSNGNNEEMDKKQKWFDTLHIPYQIPKIV